MSTLFGIPQIPHFLHPVVGKGAGGSASGLVFENCLVRRKCSTICYCIIRHKYMELIHYCPSASPESHQWLEKLCMRYNILLFWRLL